MVLYNLTWQDQMEGDRTEMIQETGTTSHGLDKSQNPDPKVGINENQKASLSATEERSTTELSKTDEQKSETNASQEKTPKKPDKILPCPRCNSMETKFCYYNNYNVSQPRHFCKNCQRYWTAGGTMRNVPVGAGRRKNKNSVAHYRQITVPEVLQGAQTETPNGIQPAIKTNGTILAFGTDAPLCESMACVLNIAEKTVMNCTQNGFHKPEDLKITAPLVVSESANEQSGHSNSKDDESNAGLNEPIAQNFPSFPSQIPCFPSASWPYPWNPSQWSSMPPPAFCPNGFAIPFYPAPPAYWGCTIPGTWNFPCVPHQSLSLETNSNSGPNSPTLGKHCRDENLLKTGNSEDKDLGKDSNSERCLWVPKTLRIDDPEEAAKSSIWTTLGIKNDCKVGSIHGGGLFKAFQPKGAEKNHTMETTSVLQANPAALSRSQTFHESS